MRKFADAVLSFYRRRVGEEDGVLGQTGAVLVVQRTSSDLRLNPHVHAVFLDGVYSEAEDGVTFHALGRLSTKDVEGVLEDAVARMTRYLRRHGLLERQRQRQRERSERARGVGVLGGIGDDTACGHRG